MKRMLGDVCRFYSGTGFPVMYQGKDSGELPFFKVGDIANNVSAGNVYLSFCNNFISRQDAAEIKGTIIPTGTVVFAKIGEALKLNRRAITSCDCLIDNNAMGVAPNQDVLRTGYFFYFMKNLRMQDHAESTTVPSVRKSKLEQVEIEVPSMDEQIEIEKILDKTSSVILMRQKELKALDDLIKARFVEMFGDPETNPKGWRKKPLSDVITAANNGMARRGNDEDGNIVMRLVELQDGYIDYSNPNRIVLTQTEKKRYLLNDKDFLFARVNGNPDNVGRCAVFYDIGEPVFHNDHIIRVHFNDNALDGPFASALLNSEYGKRQLRNQIKTSAGQYTVSQDGIGAIVAILPPLELQLQFAAFVAQIDKSKSVIQKSLDETQLLFDSLMQEYFG